MGPDAALLPLVAFREKHARDQRFLLERIEAGLQPLALAVAVDLPGDRVHVPGCDAFNAAAGRKVLPSLRINVGIFLIGRAIQDGRVLDLPGAVKNAQVNVASRIVVLLPGDPGETGVEPRDAERHVTGVLRGVHVDAGHDLLLVARTNRPPGLLAGFGQGGNQNPHQ